MQASSVTLLLLQQLRGRDRRRLLVWPERFVCPLRSRISPLTPIVQQGKAFLIDALDRVCSKSVGVHVGFYNFCRPKVIV